MSSGQQATSVELSQRRLNQMVYDLGMEPEVLRGQFPGARCTVEQLEGLAKAIAAPLSDEEFDAMDSPSGRKPSFSRSIAYITLFLSFIARWPDAQIEEALSLAHSQVYFIKYGHSFTGTFQRFLRDFNLSRDDLSAISLANASKARSLGGHKSLTIRRGRHAPTH